MKTTIERELKLEADGSLSIDTSAASRFRHARSRPPTTTPKTGFWCVSDSSFAGGWSTARTSGSSSFPEKTVVSSWRWREARRARRPSSQESCEHYSTTVGSGRSRSSGRIASGRRLDGADVTLDEVDVLDGQRVASRFTETRSGARD